MSLSYYQRSVPGWGTQQFRFGRPPAPFFQPREGWGGLDYYRAYAADADPSYYTHAVNRLSAGAVGVGMNEARYWHRRAYGGLGEIMNMLPSEIGHAAGYEAFRHFMHHASVYEAVNPGYERQKEALIGLAVGETQRLWQETGRGMEPFALQAASEAAAATASMVFDHNMDGEAGYYRGRRRSFGSDSFDPYAEDDIVFNQHRFSNGTRPYSPMPMPMGGGGVSPYAGSPMVGTGYPSSVPSSMYGGASPYNQAGSVVLGSPYVNAASPIYPGGAVVMPTTSTVSYGAPYGHIPAQTNFQVGTGGYGSYGAYGSNVGYGGGYGSGMGGVYAPGVGTMGYGGSGYVSQQPSTIVIESSRRNHRHHHHDGPHRRYHSLGRYGCY